MTDFGLARPLRSGEAAEATLGLPAGTPGYVAPEQILGPNRRQPSVDVYGLGAILYQLLAGRPPFEGGSPLETALLATKAEPTPPRRLAPDAPRDLETIALKALALNPADRFESVADMAEELRRFLAGEPLTIRPLNAWDRLGKWAGRHRVGLLAWGASALVILGGVVAILAERNHRLRLSQETVLDLVDHVGRSSERMVQEIPPGSPPIHAFYEEMLNSFEGAIARLGADADDRLRYRAALMHHHLGRSEAERFEYQAAIDHFSGAIDGLRPLIVPSRDWPDGRWVRFDLFRCLMHRARERHRLGDIAGAVVDGEEALTILADLSDEEPDNADWVAAASGMRRDMADINADGPETMPAAEAHAREALRLADRAIAMDPENPDHLFERFWAHGVLAKVHERAGRLGDAEAELRAASAATEELARRVPRGWGPRAARVSSHNELASFYMRRERFLEAEPHYDAIREHLQHMMTDLPQWDYFVRGDVSLRLDLGEMHRRLGRADQAADAYRSAIAALEEVVQERPTLSWARDELARVLNECPIETLRDPERARSLRAEASTPRD